MNRIARLLGGLSLSMFAFAAAGAELTGEAKEAQAKLQAKGAVVMPIAANTDALTINLSTAGKSAGDAELAIVKTLPKVEQLDLKNTAITDAGLANLEGLTTLTTLHLENTAVTDAGLAHLKNLSKLEYLNLFGTAVTDKGLEELKGLKSLKKLYLWQTKTTDAGIAALKKEIPGVYVNHGEDLAITTKPATPSDPAGKDEKKAADKKPDAAPAEKKPADAKTVAATEVKPTDGKAINTKCPIKGDEVDPAHVVSYNGKNIGLCCEKCQAKFTADPKKFIDKVVADAK